jgi:hypothetical protein
MATITNKHLFECGKCEDGKILITHKINGLINEVIISKCSNKKCRHQYYYKELLKVELKEVPRKLKSIRLQEVINFNKPNLELFVPVLRFGDKGSEEYKFSIVFKNKTQAYKCYDELSLLIGKPIEEVNKASIALYRKYEKYHYLHAVAVHPK